MNWHNVLLRPSDLYEELLRRKLIGGGGSSILETITGISPLTITDIASRGIESLTQFGKCVQNGTPTPSVPIDINCNNGIFSISRNLFRTTGSKTTSNGVTFDPQTDGSVKCYGRATGYANWTMGVATVNASMGTVCLMIDGVFNASGNIVPNETRLQDSSGNTLYSIPWTNWTQSANIDLSEYPTCAKITIGLKRNNNSTVNATVKVSVTVGASAVAWRPYHDIKIAGTPEVLTVESETTQTASVENLFGVGDYKDEQNIVSGEITRRVGFGVLYGTETWETDTYGGSRRFITRNFAKEQLSTVMCTHYSSTIEDGARTSPNNAYVAASGALSIYRASTQSIDTVEDWKAWLAAQYANGTPVIIVYPLAEPTTESATPQHIAARDTATITAASDYIDNIDLKVEYWKKTN